MKIITTVGTSIFRNYIENVKNNRIRNRLDYIRSPYSCWNEHLDIINHIKKEICGSLDKNSYLYISAETKSVFKILENNNRNSHVHLIATDTILSVLAAEIVKWYFEQNNINVIFDKNVDVIKGLQIENKEIFEKTGVYNLIERITQLINQKDSVIFNITGGYKAIIPYMTILGQINRIPIYYIFEGTDELIKIPQTALDFDFSIVDENYFVFHALENKKDKITKSEFVEEYSVKALNRLIENNLIEIDENFLKLTPLGVILFKRYEKLFKSKKFHRSNLLANVVELKLYKYFVNKYQGRAKVEHSKKVGNEKKWEIDIAITKNDKIIAIEVKSGGNVPLWKNRHENESIEYKLESGGFRYLIDSKEDNDLELEVYLYNPNNLPSSVIKQIEDLSKKFQKDLENKNVTLRWYHLKLSSNYASDIHWEVTQQSIKEIHTINNKTKGG